MAGRAAGTYRIADGRGAASVRAGEQLVGTTAGADGQKRFLKQFVAAWDKVMMLDRYDVHA
ncbi:MAG: hypothetical protein RQ966_10770 [Acetobacteraceae bacterium]|nr:hypothetical protein [Acetobacteraceae bacterium]